MTVCYLEIDDEITDAIARLRAVRDGKAVLVVPPGSRIATSRINFKLLAREATERSLKLVAVSDEPSARSLAISAGLPAYDSIAAAETGLKSFEQHDKQPERRSLRPRARPAKTRVDDRTQLMLTLPTAKDGEADHDPATPERARPVDWVIPRKPEAITGGAPPAGTTTTTHSAIHAGVTGRPAAEVRASRRRRRVGAAPIIGAVVLLLLLAGVGYGAYLFLPTATITLRPTTAEVRPEPFAVVAEPNVAVVDAAAGVIPAEWVDVPLSVTGQFTSTGITMRETRATGIVRFRSENTVNDVPIVQGTVVASDDGLQFETTEPVVVPRANFSTSTPGQIDVPVRAARAGPSGNVAAGEITEVPESLEALLVSVRNREPTDGGRRLELRTVSQEDFDTAVASLDGQLGASLTAKLADPTAVPRGLTAYPATAQLGVRQPEPPAETLVESEAETFTLTLSSTATVLAVNEALVGEVTEVKLRQLLHPGQQLVADSVLSNHSPGSANGATVVFEVSPSARVFAQPDQATVVADVRGKSISDARQILSAYGMVDIAIWPEFVDRLPDQAARISLVVVTPSPQP